jgi:hypothetical protein
VCDVGQGILNSGLFFNPKVGLRALLCAPHWHAPHQSSPSSPCLQRLDGKDDNNIHNKEGLEGEKEVEKEVEMDWRRRGGQ